MRIVGCNKSFVYYYDAGENLLTVKEYAYTRIFTGRSAIASNSDNPRDQLMVKLGCFLWEHGY